MIRDIHDTENVDPQVEWGPSKFYLLKDFAKILHIVLEQQDSKHSQQSSKWFCAVVFNSMAIQLCDCVVPIYNEICYSQQSRITLTKLVLFEIFFMS